ncbi:hypothetical protein [Arsenophonus endosymbiont of Aleurodicus dispersus]|nr:hypothetical protein [Arsenophonus endosymbiont of Aleurodicus dispersus]
MISIGHVSKTNLVGGGVSSRSLGAERSTLLKLICGIERPWPYLV